MQHLYRTFQLSDMYTCIRFVSANVHALRIFRISKLSHHILRKVNDNRPRFPGSCNIESLFDNSSQIFSITNCYSVFADTSCNSDDIYFLKSIISNQISRHLSGKTYKRDTIIICGRDTCYKVRRTRTACHKTNTHFAGTPCISICCVYRCLLMPWQDNSCIVLFVEFITNINGAGSGISE